nr:unnamed protein product [Hydra vulgaris]
MRLLVILACILLANISLTISANNNPTSKITSNFGGKLLMGFSNIICRLKHYKVLLNEYSQSVGCVKQCPFSFQERYSIRWGHYCMPAACFIKNCAFCKTPFVCSQCKKEYILFQINEEKTSCVKKCPNNSVRKLQNGFQKCVMVKGKKKADKGLPEGCNNQQCSSCVDEYYKLVLPNTASVCLKKCPDGYNPIAKICLACLDSRCASCKSSIAECDRCLHPYHLLLDSYNISQECVHKCPTDYITQKVNETSYCVRTPKIECPVPNCNQCTSPDIHPFHRGCVECSSGFVLYRGSFSDHCYPTCPSGHFREKDLMTNITVCTRCETPFCKECSNLSTCISCIEPFVLDFATGKCQLCPLMKEYSFKQKQCITPDMGSLISDFEGNIVEES